MGGRLEFLEGQHCGFREDIPRVPCSVKERALNASNMVVAPIVKGLGAIADWLVSCKRFGMSDGRGKKIGEHTQNSTLKEPSRDDNGPSGSPFRTSRTPCATVPCVLVGENREEKDRDNHVTNRKITQYVRMHSLDFLLQYVDSQECSTGYNVRSQGKALMSFLREF